MPDLIPAATSLIIRDGEQGLELLLLRRSQDLPFAGGCWVFPGGRIDDSDYVSASGLEAIPSKAISSEIMAAKCAAVRETSEETQLNIQVQTLISLSHWLPPKGLIKRYSTYFFICEYQGEQAVVVDNSEIDDYLWCTPKQALLSYQQKIIRIMPPTFVSLKELARFNRVAEALAYYKQRKSIYYSAAGWHETAQGRCMLYAGDAGYDGNNALVQGARHRLWEIDDEWHYECDYLVNDE